MIEASVPSAQQFRRRVVGLSLVLSGPALGGVLCLIVALIDMTTLQTQWFLSLIVAYAACTSLPLTLIQKRMLAPITDFLDCGAGGAVTAEIRRSAFETVMRLPFEMALFQGLSWIVPALLISLVLSLRFDSFGATDVAVLILSGVTGGCLTASFVSPLLKRQIEPVREILAAGIADFDARRRLIRRRSLRSKLVLGTTSVTAIPVLFAALLFHSQAEHAVQEFGLTWQRDVVEEIHNRLAREDLDAAIASLPGAGARDLEIALLDVGAPNDRRLLSDEIFDGLRRAVQEGVESGDSRDLSSDAHIVWRRVDADTILIASTPAGDLRLETGAMWIAIALLLAVSMVFGGSLTYLLADDVGRTNDALRLAADRVASGDLRKGRVLESDDETGDLARAFERMVESLRTAAGRVAETGARIEASASEIGEASGSVATVNREQIRSIEQTNSLMESISGQVRGIADSCQALNASTEESSSSILELGASGEELNETASTLSSMVAEVSNSVEQMVQSVKQVSSNTETLTEAAMETSASMEEMASSLCQVDASAEETAHLSRQVVENAEAGQERVRQTIEGMEAIRDSTETAVRVIRNLGSRTREIGAIVDVIDDVADETNLLALNAAIIAAQAGDQGRAFSVVAEEIKDLADRVQVSTREIASLVHSVREEVGNAIGAVERGAESVASGVDLSAEAGLSLEEITRASRESGTRIGGIVAAVREQAKAASHVVALMERVRSGVDAIHSASREQDRGNDVVYRSTVAMRDLAQQVRGTTEEQARGSSRIRQSVDGVQEVLEQINGSLQEQSAVCRSAMECLDQMRARAKSNDASACRVEEASRSLLRELEAQRENERRFRT